MMPDRYDVVIVGAGHGGATVALLLRKFKFAGSIALIGNETEVPYERPPLSKDFLTGEKPFERMLMRPAAHWTELDVTLLLGRHVDSVDAIGHRVMLENGDAIAYGILVWATGGTARRLSCPGHDLAGVHTVRTHADVVRMRTELDNTANVIVIGGGYIGLEAASSLTMLGKKVTVIEATARVLARVTGEPLSRFFEAEHRGQGVAIRLSTVVDCIVGRAGRAAGVRLADGEIVPADMIIVGIGIVPAVQPLLDAGVAGGNGVDVDEYCRTSVQDIYAVGDCAAHVSGFAHGTRIRLESVQNAHDQAAVAAKAITGTAAPYESVPWFWSSQYDLKLQTVGLLLGYDDILLRGDPGTKSFSFIYLREGRVLALDCINAMKDFVQGKALVKNAAAPERAALVNTRCELKSLDPLSNRAG
jgi:3-phenylpropionate/trans-cinnamate dioxygenase ferredoxin reductase component